MSDAQQETGRTEDERGPDDAAAPAQPSSSAPPRSPAVPMRMVRTPRYPVFVVTGALVGVALAVAFVLTAGEGAAGYSVGSQLGYLGSAFGLLGGLLGGGVAVLSERFLKDR